MRKISRTFLTGLAAILPAMVTLALLWWLGSTAEQVLGGMLQAVLPDLLYVPGMGIAAGIGLVFVVGVLLRAYVVRWLFNWLEGLMQRIPVVKTIHGTVRDVTNLVSGDIHQQFGQAVLVTLPGLEARVIGFVTREDFEGLPEPLGGAETLAVYLPMSYQIGGYTLMLPRDRVEPLELSLEDAMRYALTAGVSARREDPGA
ncbi:DUF502 domain-containing protein [Thioalkalivibrio sp. AKL17]|uniref:DUF502 domain-containing protein n=1 Tax=Thioalkalivibrio sp. AKL17 TaxID=1158160 RepID=UPI00035C4BF3|nr:DUF502 domain-containing protein [Thioalkalivibrio sp. AKL17]